MQRKLLQFDTLIHVEATINEGNKSTVQQLVSNSSSGNPNLFTLAVSEPACALRCSSRQCELAEVIALRKVLHWYCPTSLEVLAYSFSWPKMLIVVSLFPGSITS